MDGSKEYGRWWFQAMPPFRAANASGSLYSGETVRKPEKTGNKKREQNYTCFDTGRKCGKAIKSPSRFVTHSWARSELRGSKVLDITWYHLCNHRCRLRSRCRSSTSRPVWKVASSWARAGANQSHGSHLARNGGYPYPEVPRSGLCKWGSFKNKCLILPEFAS